MMFVAVILAALAAAPARPPVAAPTRPQVPTPESPIELDHVVLWVRPGAPERAALQKLGFRIAPTINRHDGQGTASATVEFVNGFLELVWPDSSVSVSPGREAMRERWRQRMEWRTSGRSPLNLNFRRTGVADSLPFPTYPLTAEWLPKGSAMLRFTPLTDTLGAALSLGPRELVTPPDSNAARLARNDPRGAALRHPNGCRRITGLRVTAPEAGLNAVTQMLQRWEVVDFVNGRSWLVELTLDGGRKKKTADLRPGLPLVLRW